MKTNDIRKRFLEYFQQHDHTIVPSSSLVPGNDPTLLFTNAGMVQFKDVFLGQDHRSYKRAVSSQRCVRAGGKHNDLENVGYTARHHTFFEMLGNFSFGDYFKREAIHFAWEFLTKELKLPKEKLWISIFEDDDEAADIWLKEIKIDPARFSRCGEKSNFWSMGDTGPCGPCTEIFYDHGSEIWGGPPGSPDEDGDRYIEIWNLVFMQYNRTGDGKMTPLPKPSVDTGMGLERIAAVMQGVHSNYEIDIFQHLISAIINLKNSHERQNPEQKMSMQVIADHIRSASFLIADGVTPSNEGRGYVLRRIIRRAIRHGNKLGFNEPFFYKLVKSLAKEMGEAYPELNTRKELIERVLLNEEQQFAITLDQGLKIFQQELARLTNNIIPGDVVFKLYDTYGFPADLTADIAREQNLMIDQTGFAEAMEKQRQKSQQASQFSVDYNLQLNVSGETEFTGYHQLVGEGKAISLFLNNQSAAQLSTNDEGIVILDCTPFYAEGGGQVGDTGRLIFPHGEFFVKDTQKQGKVILHIGYVKHGIIKANEKVTAEVDSSRQAIMLNHSATHLLHSALRRVLGEHVVQKGSLVAAGRLRFDFAHFEPMTAQQINAVEHLVNQQIRANLSSNVEVMKPEDAVKRGALALFGEKYGEKVRVLSMGEFSIELCGGTHVHNAGEIGIFKIISEVGVAAGVRRIEAVTGEGALSWLDQRQTELQKTAALLKIEDDRVTDKVQQLLQRNRDLEKEIERLKQKLASSQSGDLAAQAVDVADIKVLAAKIEGADVVALRTMMDELKQKWSKSVIVLAAVVDQRAHLVVGVTKNCTDKINAGILVSELAKQLGGKGGGRPDMAQGGGEDVSKLNDVLSSIVEWVKKSCH